MNMCSSGRTEKNSTLSLNLAEDPHTLDPRQVRTLRDITLVKQLFDGLTRLSPTGKPENALAEKVDISADGLTYTFTLRNATWSDGSPVTAFDFQTSWLTVLDPQFPTDYAHMLFPIKNAREAKLGKCLLEDVGIKAENATTFVVHLEHPTPYFLELTSFPTLFAFKEALFDGPFIVDNYRPDASLVLTKNPLYWQNDCVSLEKIAFTIISDNSTESLLYEKGELDWLGQPLSHNISSDHVAKLKKEGALHSFPVAGTFWLKFNTATTPFQDSRLRRALSYVIDRQAIVTHILQGNQEPSIGVLPSTMTLNSFETPALSAAKELFDSYVAEKGMPALVLSYGSTERNSKIVQFVADTWHKAFGIEVKLEGLELKSYRQKVKKGEYMVGTGDWIADFNDPVSFLDLFKYKEGSLTDTGWYNEAYSALLSQAELETNESKRSAFLAEAEKILFNEMVVAPLYHYSFDYVKNDSVTDVVLSPIGSADFKYAKKEMK